MRATSVVKVSYEEGCYVLDGCLANGGAALCLTTSQPMLRIYDASTAAHVADAPHHNLPITDIVAPSAATSAVSHLAHVVFTCQEDGGIAMTDLRAPRRAAALCEVLRPLHRQTSTISISPNGLGIAAGSDGNVHLIDIRTWAETRAIPDVHADEVTRLRFVTDSVFCSAGEDQLANFVDLAAVEEDDLFLSVANVGEVVTRMTVLPRFGTIAFVGSCEGAVLCPIDGATMETRVPRRDYSTYLVDFVELGGALCLVRGVKDDEGNAGPLDITAIAPPGATAADAAAIAAAAPLAVLGGAHREVVRVALAIGGEGSGRLVTGGEDGTLAFWAPNPSAAPSAADESAATAVVATGAVPAAAAPLDGPGSSRSSTTSSSAMKAEQRPIHLRKKKPY